LIESFYCVFALHTFFSESGLGVTKNDEVDSLNICKNAAENKQIMASPNFFIPQWTWRRARVARWYNFVPKIPIWVNFGVP
jgi:hypothetical protein